MAQQVGQLGLVALYVAVVDRVPFFGVVLTGRLGIRSRVLAENQHALFLHPYLLIDPEPRCPQHPGTLALDYRTCSAK